MGMSGNERARGLVVMYHYVRPDDSAVPGGIRPMMAGEFEAQLDWIAKRYLIVRPEVFERWMAGSETLSKPPCLLTFDDGTRDHAEVVTPILRRRGLGGVFFVLSGPAEEGLMPLTHAVHWLLGQPDAVTWELFERFAHEHRGGAAALGEAGEARRIYHYEPELRARIKYAANMALPAEATRQIVQRAIERAGRSMSDLAREWFVSADQIREMSQAGMAIGLHGHSHSSLQVLGAEGIQREIARGSDYLSALTGRRPTWWACPFGGSGASAAELSAMGQAMARAGLICAVTTRKAPVVRGGDCAALPRYDCIDLPPRKAEPPAELA